MPCNSWFHFHQFFFGFFSFHSPGSLPFQIPAGFICGRCETAVYCSEFCQRNHWPLHQKTCKEPVRKPAAGTTATSSAATSSAAASAATGGGAATSGAAGSSSRGASSWGEGTEERRAPREGFTTQASPTVVDEERAKARIASRERREGKSSSSSRKSPSRSSSKKCGWCGKSASLFCSQCESERYAFKYYFLKKIFHTSTAK